MIVSKRAISKYLARRLDDHTWIKKVPKQELLDAARQFKVRPIFQTDPWSHQLACWWLCLRYPRFMMALTMGAGKTKIVADVFTQLLRERRVRRGLVITPRVINIDSWVNDLDRHSSIEPWPIDVTEIEEKRARFFNPRGELTVIDLPSLQWVLCEKQRVTKKKNELVVNKEAVERAQRLYGDFIDLDESHKVINQESLWWDMIDRLMGGADYTYGNTGTLFDRNIEEAYTQMKLVDRGASFGTNLAVFRNAFELRVVKPWKGEQWTANSRMQPAFRRALGHRSINYEEDELFDLPKRQYVPVLLRMGEEQREHYLRALDGVISAGGQTAELESAWLRMRQITSGYLHWKDGAGEHEIRFADNPKLAALERILDELGPRTKLIVCHDYTRTGQLIVDRLNAMRVKHIWYYGGTKNKVAAKEQFLHDPATRVAVANSEAIGTGTDGLQAVCRYMVFYESPTPPKTRAQTEKRIHRPGMGDARPYIYDLMCRRTVDMGIREGHQEGYDFYAEFMSGKRRGRGSLLRE